MDGFAFVTMNKLESILKRIKGSIDPDMDDAVKARRMKIHAIVEKAIHDLRLID